MKMQHLLIEGYCDGAIGEEIHPCKNTFKLGIYCFKCTQFSFCECPNEIAISGEKGLIEYDEDCIGFGGNMEPDTLRDRGKCISLWKSICRRKIKELTKRIWFWWLRAAASTTPAYGFLSFFCDKPSPERSRTPLCPLDCLHFCRCHFAAENGEQDLTRLMISSPFFPA